MISPSQRAPMAMRSSPRSAAGSTGFTSPRELAPRQSRRHRPRRHRRMPRDRFADGVRRHRPVAPGASAVLWPPVRACAAGDRLFQPARRRTDRDLHRHGAGVAVLHRLRPFLRRERDRQRRRAVDHARTRAGAGRADGGGPHRSRDGRRDRHHARHRSDRCAVHVIDQSDEVSGGTTTARRHRGTADAWLWWRISSG